MSVNVKQENLLERKAIPEEYKWKLEDIYSSAKEWEEDLKKVEALAKEFASYQNRIGESAETLYRVLGLRDNIGRLVEKIFVFARMKRDEDNTNPQNQAMADRAQALAVRVGTMTSFFLPELIALPQAKLGEYIREESGLKIYQHFLADLARKKRHILSPEEERILALSGEIANSGEHIFTMLNNADLRFPKIRDEEGTEIELTHGRYSRFLESKDQKVRKEAFLSLHRTYHNYSNTLAASLNAGIKSNIFYSQSRWYPSALEAALDDDNIQVKVYENLIKSIREHLPIS